MDKANQDIREHLRDFFLVGGGEQILSKAEDFGTVRDGVGAAGLQVYPDDSGLVFIPLSPVEVVPWPQNLLKGSAGRVMVRNPNASEVSLGNAKRFK